MDVVNDLNNLSPTNGVELVQSLDADKLRNLRQIFKTKTIEGLNKQEFIDTINRVFGVDLELETYILQIFENASNDSKYLKWNDFLDYILAITTPTTEQILKFCKPQYISPPHVKRDSIIKIVLLETDLYFCYAIISKYGRVGLYGGNMDFLTSYSVIMAREDIKRTDQERRRRNRWITDGAFMRKIMMFVVVNSARSMTIYDASALKHVPLWLILGFPNVIQSIAFCEYKKQLCLGSENGDVIIMDFQKDKDVLFRRKHNDKLTIFYYRELSGEKDYVVVKNMGKLHEDAVDIVEYLKDDRIIITCSRDPVQSLVITEVNNKHACYTFKMRRGANCFAISYVLKLLITGSDDGVIRVWNSLVPAKPLSRLTLHKCGIVDVALFEDLFIFLSCSRDGILKLWELKEYECLQSICLNFPSFKIGGKTIEWGSRTIFPGPKRENDSLNCNKWERSHIIVACCEYYAKIGLRYSDGKERDFDITVLPPPPLQNSFLIPKDWKISDMEQINQIEVKDEAKVVDLTRLKFIIEKDILEETGQKHDINYKIATLETKKLKMRWAVEKCAPYLALDLHEIREIVLRPELPLPSSKTIRNLVDKTQKMLTDASTRSSIFSEHSSTSKSPRSSRSSVVEFD